MTLGSRRPLPQGDLAILKKWIETGAAYPDPGTATGTPSWWSLNNPEVVKVLRNTGDGRTMDANRARRQALGIEIQKCEKWNTKKFFRKATVADVTACLDAGASLMAEDWKGKTPLQVARRQHRKVLRNAWAGLTIERQRCKQWNTKKYFRTATVEDVTACLDGGANLDARDGSKWSDCNKCTPLHRASMYNGNPAVIEVLIKAGADPNARDNGKKTPPHRVTGNRNPGAIRALLKAGADPNAQSEHKLAPLHYAAWSNENPAVIEALIKAGADLTTWNKKGKTPLQVARKRNRKVLRNAWATLSDRQRAAHQARVRRKKATSGPSFLDFAIGAAGGAAIAAAGGGTEAALEAGTIFAESVIARQQPVGNSGGGVSSASANQGGSYSDFNEALRNLENSCGERYRSAFSEQDHGRFFCLDAFARHCALKKGHNQQQLDALRHDFAVLRSQGLESRCPYFGVLGGTSATGNEREAVDRADKEAREAQEEEQRRLEEQKEEARQAARERKRRIEENNARVLDSDCSCISISEKNGELTCMDGFVNITCDISR